MWVASPRRLEATANQFFARLPLDVRFELERHLEYVSLSVGKGLYERGAQAHHLLLPLTCVVGLVNVSEDALVGAEGLVGLPALLSGRVASVEAIVCTPGLAMRLPAELLRQAFVSEPAVQELVHGYMQAFVAEMIETAHCARHHGTLQQLSVLILRAQDKQGAGELLLTHERLAGMLGLRRETVSHAAQALQARGLFTYRRGHVHVTDRAGLESVACGCYARIQRVYRDVYSES